MKAHELRIGNLIHYNGQMLSVTDIRSNELKEFGFYGSVSGEVFDNYRSYQAPWLAKCSPIPLSEEWLVKFGFEARSNYFYRKVTDEMDCEVTLALLPNGWRTNAFTKAPIQYVHQLQNLYFALTGEELTIKVPA